MVTWRNEHHLTPTNSHMTGSFLLNKDLEPIHHSHRTWGFFSNFCYWGIISFNMSSWLCSSSSLSLGLSVGDIFIGYILGDLVTLAYTLMNSFPGLDWHIGYTLTQRVSFGIYGSGLGILVRVLLSIVSYGSNCYLGGQAISLLLSAWSPSYMALDKHELKGVEMTLRDLLGFLVFHALNILCVLIPPFKFNKPLIISCIAVFFAMLGMVIHLQMEAGYGQLFSYSSSTTLSSSNRGWMIVYTMTFWFSSVSPGAQNQSDYSRFSSGSKSLFIATTIALLVPTTVIPLFGIIGASATEAIYGEQIWTPTDIVLQWLQDSYSAGTRASATFISLTFISSQICLNTINCGYAGGMDLAGVLPKYINVTRGFIITAVLSFAVQPWNFYNTSSVFLTVMSSFGTVTTPIIAITICDYLVIRRRKLKLSDCFKVGNDTLYYYTYGINWRAMCAFAIGAGPGLPGMAWQVDPSYFDNRGLINFYYGNSVFEFVIPFAAYWGFCLIWPVKLTHEDEDDDSYADDADMFVECFTQKEREKLGMISEDTKEII